MHHRLHPGLFVSHILQIQFYTNVFCIVQFWPFGRIVSEPVARSGGLKGTHTTLLEPGHQTVLCPWSCDEKREATAECQWLKRGGQGARHIQSNLSPSCVFDLTPPSAGIALGHSLTQSMWLPFLQPWRKQEVTAGKWQSTNTLCCCTCLDFYF